MQKVLVSMSGGVDSSTLAMFLFNKGYEIQPVSFRYDSNHNHYELTAAAEFIKAHNLKPQIIIDARNVLSYAKSSLMGDSEIPEGHYKEESMRSTVVPGRNLIFLSILASIAESEKIPVIAAGVHQGDHFIYPDCRPTFIHSAMKTIYASTDFKVKLIAPFLMMNKAEIVRCGLELEVDYSYTRTCYKNQRIACGKCGACQERLEAFAINKTKDPIQYED